MELQPLPHKIDLALVKANTVEIGEGSFEFNRSNIYESKSSNPDI